jgi:phosphoadenosine phosphosulfate reductase
MTADAPLADGAVSSLGDRFGAPAAAPATSAITLYARGASAGFDRKVADALALLRDAGRRFSPITQASSLGVEDMVVTDLLQKSGIDASIFVLDTRKLHAETVALIGRLEAHYGRTVDVYTPDPAVAAAFVAENGEDAMYRSLGLRKACCDFRKMVPLERALAGKQAWITGLRREQSNARAEVHDIELQRIDGHDGASATRAKVNPLAGWTWGDVWHYVDLHGVPYSPLHDRFFPSIGCEPCTRAVTLGEDFRSGRWWWEQESAKECGLHVSQDAGADGDGAALEAPGFESLPGAVSSLADRPASHAAPVRPITVSTVPESSE